jgi:hypothetical protein
VRAVSTAWEMERHHSAERHLYPEVLDVFNQIRTDHPDAIIGAVTDGRSNPLFMVCMVFRLLDYERKLTCHTFPGHACLLDVHAGTIL